MKIELSLLREEHRGAAVQLADDVFRTDGQTSMGIAYPEVFSPALGQSYALFEEGKLVSFMGLVPEVIRIGNARLQAYSIGAVCTHPSARGKGYASELLTRAKAHADEAGASLLLVSGDRGLYTGANCHRFGWTKHMAIEEEHIQLLQSSSSWQCRDMLPTDGFRIKRLSDARPIRYEQSLGDLAVHIYAAGEASNSKSIHKVLIAERSGEAAAFVVVAVSADGTPGDRAKAVEWAGDSAAVAALFAEAVRRYRPGRLDIFVPWHEADLISTLGDIPGTTRKNAGTVHIVSPERLFRQLQPYLHSVGAAERVSVKALPDNRCSLTIGGGVKADLQAGEMVSFLFDPDVPPAARVLREKLEGVFPIPFPYTGGLNFV